MPELLETVTAPEVPKWVHGGPPDIAYDLTAFDTDGGGIEGWSFSLTRHEFIALKDHLAKMRGFPENA